MQQEQTVAICDTWLLKLISVMHDAIIHLHAARHYPIPRLSGRDCNDCMKLMACQALSLASAV